MQGADLELLINAARRSGEIAKQYWRGSYATWDKSDGAGPVTQADLDVNAYLSKTLRKQRPEYGWLSEESEDDQDRLDRERCFIVDPLDGTRSFIQGDEHWAHSFAIARQGVVEAAVVFLPVRNLMYFARRGQGAYCNDIPLKVSDARTIAASTLLAARPAISPEHWRNGDVPSFERRFRPSLAYRLALVAQGRYDGMITFRDTWEWDIAAGSLLIHEAGGRATDRQGRDLVFNSPTCKANGIVAASTNLHDDICKHLATTTN